MPRVIVNLVIVLVSVLPLHPARSLAGCPPGVERELWYVVRFDDSAVGVARDRWTQFDGGMFHESYLEIRARRLDAPLEFYARTAEWDDCDRRLIRFETEMMINGERSTSAGVFRGGTVRIRNESGGFVQRDSVPWDATAIGLAGVDEELARRLRQGEERFSIYMFDPRFGRFRRSFFTMTGKSDDGDWIVHQSDEGSDVVTAQLWLDQNYHVRRMESQQLNMLLVMERIAPDEVATLELDPNFDMIRRQQIPCEGYPGSPGGLSEVEFTLAFQQPVTRVNGFTGPNQRVLSQARDTLRVLVSRAAAALPAITDETVFLRPSRHVQSDHAGIRAVADSLATSSGVTGIELARTVARWVNQHVTEKTYGRGFSSAVEVLESRAGDCSEHSVLLAATLRAAGIPARIVVGLTYHAGNFIGHMWTEAYVDGWITLDALDPNDDPKRMRITASPDERAIDETDVVNAYSLVAGLRVQVTGFKENH
jgi:transglutaminase-like putative cysteine protease